MLNLFCFSPCKPLLATLPNLHNLGKNRMTCVQYKTEGNTDADVNKFTRNISTDNVLKTFSD